ncbi:unnamed protein product [Alopecurus aequalis]
MAATSRAILVALLVALAFLFSERAGAATAETAWRSAQRRRQVRSLLKRLNKPPLASIESPDGDIIDCVHISIQPAFDHPSLKNHKIQMRPSIHPRGLYDDSNIAPHPMTQTWHQNGKCPENTVPIRRTKEEDVMRAISVERYGRKRPRSIPKLISIDDLEGDVTTGHQHAVSYATGDNSYYGTKMSINLWQPKTDRDSDFSLAQLWIIAGSYSHNELNTIEAGWQVFPALYGDDNSRLFIYWTRDAYNTTGCYNLMCSGFIQTSNQYAIGGSLSPVSIYDSTQYVFDILIWKDPNGGNWWLQVGGNYMGYWPSSIFTQLASSADSVMWGGEVYSPEITTPMGSGHFPEEGFSKASYIRTMQVVDSSNQLKSPNGVGLIATQPDCYNVTKGASSGNWGTYIYYGGPACKNPKAVEVM